MSKKDEGQKKERREDGKKCKEVCCEKYLKKGKHCKDCPLAGECRLPG
jgi:hypothetical protein